MMYPLFVHFIEPLPEQWRRNGTTTFFADTKSSYAPKNEQRWHQTTSLALNVVQLCMYVIRSQVCLSYQDVFILRLLCSTDNR